jgi:hypothetical protein
VEHDTSLAVERPLAPEIGLPGPLSSGNGNHRFDVVVIFTSSAATLAALKLVGTLVNGLNAHITLLAPQVVPYCLPLDCPPVFREFSERRLRDISTESLVQTTVRLYLCRDRWATLVAVLKKRSIIVIGGRTRWWPTKEQRLARDLRRYGHDVIFLQGG